MIDSCKSVRELRALILSQKVSVKEVVAHYCLKSYTIGRERWYTADECYTSALKEAEIKDKELKEAVKQGKNLDKEFGLFFGIPFSVKDQIYVNGMISSMGVGSRADKVVDKDAVSVELIKRQGGIPFVHGNCSEACLYIVTKSIIWGDAKHPQDSNRTTGGSSGGDAGLIATGCSPFALGSDYAGSIRIPSLLCGTVGFCPTHERHSIRGLSCYTDKDGVFIKPFRPAIGPMGRCVDDVVDGIRALCSGDISDYDLSVPNVKFDEDMFNKTLNKKLRIGVITNFNNIDM